MESWLKISLLLCVFGFLKELRPSEPFIYDYLTDHRWRNLTGDEIAKQVYPVGTYSNLGLLVLVFLITDLTRYKPLIIALGLSGIIFEALLIWTTSLEALQILEVFYGMFCASEVAYYTYIYAKVDKQNYQKVTSHTRGAILVGRCISGITSQVLISTKLMDFKQLNYITFTSVTLATIWGFLLPSVPQSLYFHSKDNHNEGKIKSAFILMKNHFLEGFSNWKILKWSIWWSLSTCGYIQVENYMQPLYSAIQDNNETALNGAVEASLTLLGFMGALLAGYLTLNWETIGELILGIISLIQGILIVVISQTDSIILCYCFYVTFGVLYHFMVTIASAQIAEKINQDSYGLIFGINNFFALIAGSLLTLTVATEGVGFALAPRGQYIVYGGYHLIISVIFGVMGTWTCLKSRKESIKNTS